MQEKILMLPEDKEKLEKEKEQLIKVEKPRVGEELALARSQGDLSENADYSAAKDNLARIESRISEIEYELEHCEIILKKDKKKSSKISMGDVVTYTEVDGGESITVRITGTVGSNPGLPIPAVSNECPLGMALIGHEVGQVVTVNGARPYEIRIDNVK